MTDEGLIAASCIKALEEELCEASTSKDYSEARRILRGFLRDWVEENNHNHSIAELVGLLNNSEKNKPIIPIILRCLSVDGFFTSSTSEAGLERPLVTLVEAVFPELISHLKIDKKDQTYLKFGQLRSAHGKILEILAPVKSPFKDMEAALNSRKNILGALNHGLIRSYCSVFNVQQVRAVIEGVFSKLKAVNATEATFLVDIDACREAISDGRQIAQENGSFLAKDFLFPFLDSVDSSLDDFFKSSRAKFSTKILPGFSGSLQKKYPLHDVEREIKVVVPFRNIGPGLATGVRVGVNTDCESIIINNPQILLGNVHPGDFSAVIDIVIVDLIEKCDFILEVFWREIGAPEELGEIYEFSVHAQTGDVDWAAREYWTPYSPEPAEGENFLGRQEKVRFLAGMLLRTPMEPFYITGQKRVGKTSLALAALKFAEEKISPPNVVHKNYILWGAIAHEDPRQSMNELGQNIDEFVRSSAQELKGVEKADYSGSLSALIKLCELAYKIAPERRFVVVIDEFDEIHQELYSHGNLAETFFANLRALSRCKNICLVLVGGENMPYIMERQGQKLNNFSRVSVNYYSRETDWADFELLVRGPTKEVISWHDGAVSEIFNASNGNPYFTKIICAAVLRNAIKQRDSDITASEVGYAIEAEVSSLGANSFAHLWRDGISKSLDEREPDILIRSRVLVAIARCIRSKNEVSLANIVSSRGVIPISEHEVAAVLKDFGRREVLKDRESEYIFVLPIFKQWLVDVGAGQLAAESISSELAQAMLAEENAALVRSEEVANLAASWPTYRGRYIGADEIRAWFQQVPSARDQRALFDILKRVRFLSEDFIRQRLKDAHSIVRAVLPDFIMTHKANRRRDVVVTYVDGEGKSGATFAATYAEVNTISATNIFPPSEFTKRLGAHRASGGVVSAVVIVDDLAATGQSLLENVEKFMAEHGEIIRLSRAPVRVISILAMPGAQERILRGFEKIDGIDIDFRTCEILGEDAMAFPESAKGWATINDMERARALCVDYGAKIFNKQSPLGYGGLGLLIVFPTNTPNNSLPILHSHARVGTNIAWKPIFPRVLH